MVGIGTLCLGAFTQSDFTCALFQTQIRPCKQSNIFDGSNKYWKGI